MHLVGFIIRIYHDARSTERQIFGRSKPTWDDSNSVKEAGGFSEKLVLPIYLSTWGHILGNRKIVYLIG